MDIVADYIAQQDWVWDVFLVVFATALARFVAKLLFDRLARKFSATKNLYDDALLAAARRPLGLGIWVIGVSIAANAVAWDNQQEMQELVQKLRDAAVVGVLVWFTLRFIHFIEEHVVLGGYSEAAVDQTTANAVAKLLRATVMITGVLLVLQAFNISISGVLAFGGIGGIAVGFAARDMLANFFGGLMIFLDRPFAVGDWIRSPDRDIEGTVEEIGWRLTRIRTFDKRPLYIPNSVFTSLAVENPSRMQNRRIYETVGLRYDDIGVMAAIVADVERMLRQHEAIDGSLTLMVNFVEFGASSVDFFVYCFTSTTVWTEFHVIKQDILLQIAEIVAEHGAEIAFPTQTLLIEPEPGAA